MAGYSAKRKNTIRDGFSILQYMMNKYWFKNLVNTQSVNVVYEASLGLGLGVF